ncbi:hypothetical protein OH76DRAFT_1399295 [Lentinus brumalis]|uniref:Uncharacterized protein n=1 Tax=Lentinus brumalis TaxID=2498619 RepID=A0A371DLH6_9APHY|nr:hypothetical protein OH76DRAFT_1399295 [Polyporus brumalis]
MTGDRLTNPSHTVPCSIVGCLGERKSYLITSGQLPALVASKDSMNIANVPSSEASRCSAQTSTKIQTKIHTSTTSPKPNSPVPRPPVRHCIPQARRKPIKNVVLQEFKLAAQRAR